MSCSISRRITARNTTLHQSAASASPVEYCFDRARTKRSEDAWAGIERFGPFSRDLFAKQSPKILVLFPDTIHELIEPFLHQFREGIVLSNERPSLYPNGFARTYKLADPEFLLRGIPSLTQEQRNDPERSYREVVEAFLAEPEAPPAIALVVISDEHNTLPEAQNPYLAALSILLAAGIPVQKIRVPTLTQQTHRLQFTLQNLSLQLYAKLNGTPWVIDHISTPIDEFVIGLGTCALPENRLEPGQHVLGIATVFRGDGSYLFSTLSPACRDEEYPSILRQSLLEVLTKIKEQNRWRSGDTVRIVFHRNASSQNIEIADLIAECVDTICGEQNVEFALLTVSYDHLFSMLDMTQEGVRVNPGYSSLKGVYTPERGTIVKIGRFARLLGVSSPKFIMQPNYPLPAPLLIHLHPSSTFCDQQYLTTQVLKFTSLAARSTVPIAKPVTVYYAELIADLLNRLQAVPGWSPSLLPTNLKTRRWFL